jgi:hypothetical protein
MQGGYKFKFALFKCQIVELFIFVSDSELSAH